MQKKTTTIIYLLRNDLRLHDNEVLLRAAQSADRLVPLYCFDPRHFGRTHYFGFPKTGPHRARFLLESVADVRRSLRAKGSDLVIRIGKPEEVVPELVRSLPDVSAVYLQREVCSEEVSVEKQLKQNCKVPVMLFWGSTIFHIDHVLQVFRSVKNIPDVYTQFRKRMEADGTIRPLFPTPTTLKPLPSELFERGELPAIDDLLKDHMDLKFPPEADQSRSAFPFKGGETSAIQRLNYYFWEKDYIQQYFQTRNGLIGPDYSSKFSPWLALGCISPCFINAERLRYEEERVANKSTYWIFFELLWRDYFKFIGLKYGNALFHLEGLLEKAANRYDEKQWKHDEGLFKDWTEGQTGIPWVDANMRELKATGFMSNRGRQNVASFLAKDLNIDWRMGAEWFEYLLVDHDPTSNYGNWQYASGVGNDPRENRRFNMLKQVKDYDPDGSFIKLWCPEIARIPPQKMHSPWALSAQEQEQFECVLGKDYPSPIFMDPYWTPHQDRPAPYSRAAFGSREKSQQTRNKRITDRGNKQPTLDGWVKKPL